jgi:hypothetical protein
MDELKVNFKINKIDFTNNQNVKSNSRFIKPPKQKDIEYSKLKYVNAKKLAKDIDFNALDKVFCIVDGSFIFGDFIEAFILENNINCLEMQISTLSYSQDNIDSLEKLIKNDYIQKLDLIVSDYFFSHERNKLIKNTYNQLDVKNIFQLATAGTHFKTCIFKTEGGKHIIIHGSANLRSSSNIEHFTIEDNKDLYYFIKNFSDEIIEKYKTINKSVRGNQMLELIKN